MVWEEDESDIRPLRKRPGSEKRGVETREGQVSGIGPRGCDVWVGEEVLQCKPRAGLAVGDRVAFDSLGHIREVRPRKTTLSRPDPMNPKLERVVAANVDVVVIVASIRKPELRPGLVDRYLIAIEKGGAEAVLCVSKIDLVESEADWKPLEPYRDLGLRVFPISVKTKQGLPELREGLRESVAVLVGHSGVGKSSLLNALLPEARALTGEISSAYNKGRHTTTGSTMYDLGHGTKLIDTPGIREFGLWEITPAEIAQGFKEFAVFSGACQFGDCTHTHEPVCGVKQALEGGKLARARYETYLRIRQSEMPKTN